MNDGLLKVDFGMLSQAGADIQKALHELETQLGQLEADARPLVATWDGQAQQAYADRQRKWSTAAADLKHILREIKLAVSQSAQDYATTEGNAERRFST
jgi:WXG100 family type VII secretion target